MLLAKNKTLKQNQPDPRVDAISGVYTSQETRLEQKRVFSGASFLLGDKSQSKSIPSLHNCLFRI
jgi:hypothetical protein